MHKPPKEKKSAEVQSWVENCDGRGRIDHGILEKFDLTVQGDSNVDRGSTLVKSTMITR